MRVNNIHAHETHAPITFTHLNVITNQVTSSSHDMERVFCTCSESKDVH